MKKESRIVNSLRNMSWGITFKLVSLIFSFLNKTVIIRSIGLEYAGVANLFTSVMSVLNMAELGLNSAILFSMYNSIAVQNTKRTNALLSFYRKAYIMIGSAILIVGLLLCTKIDWFIAGEYPKGLNIYAVCLIFLANTVSSYIFFAYYSIILSANQREDIIYRNNIIVHSCSQAIQFAVLLFLKDYYVYILVALIATMIFNYLNYRSARRKFPEYICEGTITSEERKLLKKQISGLMIGKLSVISRNSFDSIVISSVLGLTATAIYGNYYYIMFSIFGLIIYFCSGMKASIGNKIAACSVQENYTDLLEFSFMFYVIYGICSVILLCLYQPFMELWVGKEYMSTFLLALLMCIYFFFFCATGIVSQYWEAAGLFWENRFRFVIEAVLNLVLDVVLVKVIGLYGIILATIITMIFSSNILGPHILFKHYFHGCSLKRYFYQQIKYFLYTLIAGSMAYNMCLFVNENNMIGLFVRLFISTLVATVVILFLSFKSKECQNILRRYGHLIGLKNDVIREKTKKIIYSILFIFVVAIGTLCIALNIFVREEGYTAEYIVTLPDVKGSLENNGFTCTGMAYDEKNKEFLIGNIGKNLPSDSSFSSSIVVLTQDLKVVKREIDLSSMFPDMDDIQGVTIDQKDGSIWFCSYGENMVRHISKNGEDLGYIEVSQPTGIAYNADDNSLYILTTSELLNVTENGGHIWQTPIALEGQDQLYLDSLNKKIYITAGINYQGENYVYSFDLITKEVKKVFDLADSNAIEGIVIIDNYMFIANDGYYHSAKNPKNIIAVYNLDNMNMIRRASKNISKRDW